MYIPTGFIVPLYVASFIALTYQYLRQNPDKRLLNLRFAMMAGAILLMLATVFMADWSLSVIFFLLAVVWVGLTIYLIRFLPPPGH